MDEVFSEASHKVIEELNDLMAAGPGGHSAGTVEALEAMIDERVMQILVQSTWDGARLVRLGSVPKVIAHIKLPKEATP